MNLNKVFVLGNLTRDPEKKSLPSGQSVASFGVATNRFYTSQGEKKQDTEFHNIVTFGRLADIASQYLKRGSLVLIEGRLKTRSWQDNSGNTHYRTEIIAQSMQLGPKGYQENNVPGPTETISPEENSIPIIEEDDQTAEDDNSAQKSQHEKIEPDEEEEIDIKDIPF